MRQQWLRWPRPHRPRQKVKLSAQLQGILVVEVTAPEAERYDGIQTEGQIHILLVLHHTVSGLLIIS